MVQTWFIYYLHTGLQCSSSRTHLFRGLLNHQPIFSVLKQHCLETPWNFQSWNTSPLLRLCPVVPAAPQEMASDLTCVQAPVETLVLAKQLGWPNRLFLQTGFQGRSQLGRAPGSRQAMWAAHGFVTNHGETKVEHSKFQWTDHLYIWYTYGSVSIGWNARRYLNLNPKLSWFPRHVFLALTGLTS